MTSSFCQSLKMMMFLELHCCWVVKLKEHYHLLCLINSANMCEVVRHCCYLPQTVCLRVYILHYFLFSIHMASSTYTAHLYRRPLFLPSKIPRRRDEFFSFFLQLWKGFEICISKPLSKLTLNTTKSSISSLPWKRWKTQIPILQTVDP